MDRSIKSVHACRSRSRVGPWMRSNGNGERERRRREWRLFLIVPKPKLDQKSNRFSPNPPRPHRNTRASKPPPARPRVCVLSRSRVGLRRLRRLHPDDSSTHGQEAQNGDCLRWHGSTNQFGRCHEPRVHADARAGHFTAWMQYPQPCLCGRRRLPKGR